MRSTSTATTGSDRQASRTHRGKRARTSTLLWAAQILLAAVFIFAADMAGASIINIAVLHSAAVAVTIPLCAAFALIAHARWKHTTRPLAAAGGR